MNFNKKFKNDSNTNYLDIFSKGYNKHIYNKVKSGAIQLGETTKEWLKRSTGEAIIFAVLGLGIGGIIANNHENDRKKIPLGFSELETLEDNNNLGPISKYQLKTNDMCMKIFEAYNHGIESNSRTEIFAREIYDAFSYRNIYRYNLHNLLEQVPTYKPLISKELLPYTETAKTLYKSNKLFEDSWDERHTDNYHTEVRFRTVTDSKGNTHSEMYTVQVYDDTDHYYYYNKTAGEAGAKILNEQFKKIPKLELTESFHTTTKTHPDGEMATEKSRGLFTKGMEQKDLLDAANSWYTGSTIIDNLNTIHTLYPQLNKKNNTWNVSKNRAHDEHYKTYSHSDSGPKEYQDAKKVLETGKELNASLTELLHVIDETSIKVPILEQKINQFIDKGYIHYASDKKEAKKLSKEIMKLTKEIYKLNFKKGIEVTRYRRRVLFLGFLLGGIIGVGVGIGVDYITNEFNLYDKIKFHKKSNY